MSKKTIWIIHQYASTPETGMGGRHYYLADELGKMGHKVYVIASSANHLLRNSPELTGNYTFEARENFTFVWVKMPEYKEAHSKQRAINWLLFPWKIQKLSKIIADKPDAILSSSPSPIAFLGAERLAKKFKARLVFEVRDIWPLTLIELGGYSPKHPFIRFMQWVEDRAYRNSDRVISNLKNSVEHMVSRGMAREKFSWIPNGVSLAEIEQKSDLSQDVISQLPKDTFIVGYTGTLGVANALDTLLEAAALLKEYQHKIAFVLVGSGKEKEHLKQLALSLELQNVYFIDPIPKASIQNMLAMFNVCYIGWLKDDLYRFGIGANKIPEYLYSGKPILHGYSGACDPVKELAVGKTVEAEDSKALSAAICELYEMPEVEREVISNRARKAVVEQYEFAFLAKKLEEVLFEQGK